MMKVLLTFILLGSSLSVFACPKLSGFYKSCKLTNSVVRDAQLYTELEISQASDKNIMMIKHNEKMTETLNRADQFIVNSRLNTTEDGVSYIASCSGEVLTLVVGPGNEYGYTEQWRTEGSKLIVDVSGYKNQKIICE